MKKYRMVYDIVTRLTDDPTLRTFFILYLMARSEEERQLISRRFWQDAESLNEIDRQSLKNAFNRSFKQLLPLANQLFEKVTAAQTPKALPT